MLASFLPEDAVPEDAVPENAVPENATFTEAWYDQIARQGSHSRGFTVGLISGHRDQNDPRCIYRIAARLTKAMANYRSNSGLLVCRLEVRCPLWGSWLATPEQKVEPIVEKSALGDWHQVDVPMTLGNTAPWSLQQLPRWLPRWKLRYNIILIDLGPIHLVSSRTIGRLCDSNYIVLGPNSTASAQWILQYADYHAYCGSHIAGTLLTGFAA